MVVIHSESRKLLGERFVLACDLLTLGHGPENGIVLDGDGVSRWHARIERRGARWYVVNLDSMSGTYVNDESVSERELRSGDRVRIRGTVLKYVGAAPIEHTYTECWSNIDGLTQAHTRWYLLQELDQETRRVRLHGRHLSLLMLDVDHLTQINATYGHLAGDSVLRDVARLLKSHLRPDDLFARYGGEEFCALLRGTPLVGAAAIAEDLRRRVEAHGFTWGDERIPVTVSIGGAELTADLDAPGLVKSAHEKLLQSKHAGRNRVSI